MPKPIGNLSINRPANDKVDFRTQARYGPKPASPPPAPAAGAAPAAADPGSPTPTPVPVASDARPSKPRYKTRKKK